MVSVVSIGFFGGFSRFCCFISAVLFLWFHFGSFVLAVLFWQFRFVGFVLVVSFQRFHFGVSGFSTCD